jgi:hypothetical protein
VPLVLESSAHLAELGRGFGFGGFFVISPRAFFPSVRFLNTSYLSLIFPV